LARFSRHWLGLAVLVAAFAAAPVQARTVSASSGMSEVPANATCFGHTTGGFGVFNTCTAVTTNRVFVVPIIFDTAGGRNILVTGRANTNGNLQCQVVISSFDGVVVTSTSFQTWPKNGVYQQRTFNVTTVPFGGTGIVRCFMSGSATSRLNVIDYGP